ncbi:MAG: hypothetical protein ACRELW_02565 [Candidatus Rokuibacteriota bacterium]
MIARLLRKRLHRPEAIRLLIRDALGGRGPVLDNRRHLAEAARWILRAQAATPDTGVSGGYSFEDGWIASYPETTGYIIPTLLDYAAYAGESIYRDHALSMARWELGVQLESGGFPGHFVDRAHPPVVFNTGQIIFGLLAAFECTQDEAFLRAAQRAAGWLVSVLDADGVWRRFDYRDQVHSYNTRSAWALVELALVTKDEALLAAARRHLDWACGQQRDTGWFEYSSFSAGVPPFLHTIAYTSQGLLEAGLRLQDARYVAAAEHTCRAVLGTLRPDGSMPGTFHPDWRPAAAYSCLTGNAQISAQWLRLYSVNRDAALLDGARRANRFLKSLQYCAGANLNVRGAIKGSHPIWGRYLFGTYPNWAAKFFMDALLMEEAAPLGSETCIRCW